MIKRTWRVLELSWKSLAMGAGLGLTVATSVLLIATVVTFNVEFNEQAAAYLAYTILVVSTVTGAALAVTFRRG